MLLTRKTPSHTASNLWPVLHLLDRELTEHPEPPTPVRVYSSAVERLTADQQVPGSNPGAPSYCGIAGFLSPCCESQKYASCDYHVHVARLAQSVERQPFKLVVVGSSPTSGEVFRKGER